MSHMAEPGNPETASPQALPWVERLVSFDTVSRNSEPRPDRNRARRIACRGHRIHDHHRQTRPVGQPLRVPCPRTTAKPTAASCFGPYGRRPGRRTGLVSDPFKPEIRDGLLYGRGTCDMKGFIGTALALLPKCRRRSSRGPIHFALSFDEEIGCAGAPLMLTDLQKRGVRRTAASSASRLQHAPDHRAQGHQTYNCCVRGFAAHSSLTPKGLNAIEYAARLICFIRDVADEFRAEGPFDELYDVPFTTAQTSTIKGGNAVNTVPAECSFAVRIPQPADDGPRARSSTASTRTPAKRCCRRCRRNTPNAAIEFSRIASAPGSMRPNRPRSRSSCAR